jgi:hypothetical protein
LLWEERERRRLEILAAVELSKASPARGEDRTVTTRQESDQLVSDVAQFDDIWLYIARSSLKPTTYRRAPRKCPNRLPQYRQDDYS